jgi:cobalt-zinc-cadmium efflux system outer membrane protein
MRTVLRFVFVLPVGCASINPQQDYQRAGEYISQSTGHRNLQPQDGGEAVQRHVDKLLGEGLTITEAVKISLLNNPEFQAAWMDIGMSRAELVQAGLFSNPTVGIALQFPSGGGLANLEAGLAQNIADLWQIPSRKHAASRALNQAILNLARKATKLAADAKTAYYQAAGATQLLAIRKENLKVARELLKMARTRQRAGAANQLEVNLSRSMALDSQLAEQSARLSKANALRRLAKTLGLTRHAEKIELKTGITTPPPSPPSTDELVERALASRLDIKAAQESVGAAASRLKLEHARVFPNVELGLAMEREARKAQGGRDVLADTARASIANGQLTAPDIQPRSERDQDTDFIIGPSFNMELPVWDQNQAQIAKAAFVYRQNLRMLDALQRAVIQDVRTAVDQARTAWDIAAIYQKEFVPLAKDNLELSREAYQAGQASFLSVLEAQRFFLDSRAKYIEALQKASSAVPNLERTIGLPYKAMFTCTTTQPGLKNVPTTQPRG